MSSDEAKIDSKVVNSISIQVGIKDKKLWIEPYFDKEPKLPKRIRGYAGL